MHASDSPPFRVVPGDMGPNALPTIATEDPVLSDQLYLEIAWLSNYSASGDYSAAPYFRVILPFNEFIALEFDGTPFEQWYLTNQTYRAWNNPHQSGTSKGDIRFGVRGQLFQEREIAPAIGIRLLVKTTTGKSLEDRRFINAPGYIIEGLLGKTVFTDEGLLKKIRILAKLGFFAWQQPGNKQDDAFDYGLETQFLFDHGIRIDLDWRGYAGYEHRDKPSEIAVRVNFLTKYFDFYVGGATCFGLGQPSWSFIVGLAAHLDLPNPPWIGDKPEKP